MFSRMEDKGWLLKDIDTLLLAHVYVLPVLTSLPTVHGYGVFIYMCALIISHLLIDLCTFQEVLTRAKWPILQGGKAKPVWTDTRRCQSLSYMYQSYTVIGSESGYFCRTTQM